MAHTDEPAAAAPSGDPGVGGQAPTPFDIESLKRRIGQEIPTPQGIGVLESVQGDLATVVFDHVFPVVFRLTELTALDRELCAVCQNFAVAWCTACGRPVCAAHRLHGQGGTTPTAYVLSRVLSKLVRHGSTAVLEPEVAYAALSLAHERAIGPVALEPGVRPGHGGEGFRLVLRTSS